MKRTFSLCLILLALTTSALAQRGRGTLLGTVADSSGAGPDGKNNNDAFGRITSSRDPRLMQLGLKLIF